MELCKLSQQRESLAGKAFTLCPSLQLGEICRSAVAEKKVKAASGDVIAVITPLLVVQLSVMHQLVKISARSQIWHNETTKCLVLYPKTLLLRTPTQFFLIQTPRKKYQVLFSG